MFCRQNARSRTTVLIVRGAKARCRPRTYCVILIDLVAPVPSLQEAETRRPRVRLERRPGGVRRDAAAGRAAAAGRLLQPHLRAPPVGGPRRQPAALLLRRLVSRQRRAVQLRHAGVTFVFALRPSALEPALAVPCDAGVQSGCWHGSCAMPIVARNYESYVHR